MTNPSSQEQALLIDIGGNCDCTAISGSTHENGDPEGDWSGRTLRGYKSRLTLVLRGSKIDVWLLVETKR